MDLIVMSEAASYYFAKRTAGTGRGVDRQLVAKENPFQVFADLVLMAAIRRLRLPYDSVSRTISVAQTITMSRAELKTEKANIKWEFVLYDQLFVKKWSASILMVLGRSAILRDAVFAIWTSILLMGSSGMPDPKIVRAYRINWRLQHHA